jgi:RHS repeat-associated protein
LLPTTLDPSLRYQKGYNKWISPWVIAIADPRASSSWDWGNASAQARISAGCHNCSRPASLEGKSSPDVHEIYSSGRFFAVRPDTSGQTSLDGTAYAYLDGHDRMSLRIATVMADTVRTADVIVPAQDPPVAGGIIPETVLLHSGELVTSAVDLDAGGRSGMNLVVDRTYRSRTLGSTSLGAGWDSTLFQRLRALPNGDVEYRDGSGEIRLFQPPERGTDSAYQSPKGVFLKLVRSDDGWVMFDPQWRATRFDSLGRVSSIGDEFVDESKPGSGNVVRFLYSADGRLARAIDPVGRMTSFEYYGSASSTPGLLKSVRDWRSREVEFHYSSTGKLVSVELPEVSAAAGLPSRYSHGGAARPTVRYAYDAASYATANDRLELGTNLVSITDPAEADETPTARIEFSFEKEAPATRDQVLLINVPCGSFTQEGCKARSATFTWNVSSPNVVDLLGQTRVYSLRLQPDGFRHITRIEEPDVPVLSFAEGRMPNRIGPDLTGQPTTLVTTFADFNEHGQARAITLPSGTVSTSVFDPVQGGAVGTRLAANTLTEGSVSGAESAAVIETTISYESDSVHPNAVNFPASTSKGGVTREATSAHRGRNEVERTDVDVREVTKFDEAGRVSSSGTFDDTGATTAFTFVTSEYFEDSDPVQIRRGTLRNRTSGSGSEQRDVRVDYTPLAGGAFEQTVTDVNRGTKVITRYDSWDRPIDVRTIDRDGTTPTHEQMGYDATGRFAYHSRLQQPLGSVVDTYRYDPTGRLVESTSTGANVMGEAGTALVTNMYVDLGERKQTVVSPHKAADVNTAPYQVTELDGLGRPVLVSQKAAGSQQSIVQRLAYDTHGQTSYVSDTVRVAHAVAHDAFGREVESRSSDGTSTSTSWNDWSEPQIILAFGADGNAVAQTNRIFTRNGRLRAVNERMDPPLADSTADRIRQTRYTWEQGDTRLGVRTGLVGEMTSIGFDVDERVRVSETWRDAAGRTTRSQIGESVSNKGDLSLIFLDTQLSRFDGAQPGQVLTSEPLAGASYLTTLEYDALGRVRRRTEAGTYESRYRYDETGNVLGTAAPGMNEATATHDSRGLALEQKLSDGAVLQFRYDALGNLRQYVDQQGQATTYDTDALGRVVKTTYNDGTTEEVVYEDLTGLTKATKNRAGEWRSYQYDAAGRVSALARGADPSSGTPLIRYEYDAAGRLTRVANVDSAVIYGEHDFLGRPRMTRTVRYENGSGLSDTPVVRDEFTQNYRYDAWDEIVRWSMPVRGPHAPAAEIGGGWRTWIDQEYDAGGNLIAQRAATSEIGDASSGEIISRATGRGVGRISQRTRGTNESIVTKYQFADGEVAAPAGEIPQLPGFTSGVVSGVLRAAATSRGNFTIAGSFNAIDDSQRVGATLDLGVDDRASIWSYDDRSRLQSQRLLALRYDLASASRDREQLTAADFREGFATTSPLSDDQLKVLGDDAWKAARPSWTVTERLAHQAGTQTLRLTPDIERRVGFEFEGGRRTKSGDWTAAYDEFDRVVAVQSVSAGRRIEYRYDPMNRMIARTAWELPSGGGEKRLETRAGVIEADGLPADATFVWDPLTDRLVAIFRSGTTDGGGIAEGLVRQIVHGDRGYDDPVEVLTANEDGTVRRDYPIVDEAGSGSVHAVADASGMLVERVLYGDSYGDEPRYLGGAVVDRIEVSAKTDARGDLAEVAVRVHVTDRVDEDVVTQSLTLKAGAVTAAGQPVLGANDHDVLLRLTGDEWAVLTAGQQSIEIVVTTKLRAPEWDNAPVIAPPDWAKKVWGVESTPTTPLVVHQSLETLAAFFETIASDGNGSTSVYAIPDLYLAASSETKTKLLTGFKAAPFVEPANGLAYFRARWYDPSTGTFLTPDPMGYQDSSNLYAFAGGDPINNSDPTGKLCETANASGFFNWVGRCAQDSLWVAGDTANGLFNPVNGIKNTKRALGGVVGLGKLAVKTGVGLGELALDTNPIVMSLDPIGSTQRSLARLQAVGEVVAHPIDAITTAHSEAADRIIAAEQAGNYYAAGAEASEIAAADTLAVLGAAETGLAVAKFARNAITKSTIERIGSRVYDNSVRAESRRMVEIEGRNIWEDSFNSDLGRSAGRRAQLVMQRWARRQSGKFATPNWAFGDIAGSQLRMFPPANPRVNPLVTKPRAFVIPDVYYRPLSFGLDFKLTNYKNLPQDWGYVTYQPLSEIRKVIFNPYAYRR